MLGQIEYRRVDALSQTTQNAKLEADLRSQYAVQALRVEAVEQEAKRMFAALESRMEAFIEYVVALTMDRLSGSEKIGVHDGLADAQPILDPDMAALKTEIVAEIDKEVESTLAPASTEHRHILSANSDAFFDGWNHLERDRENRYFRWMARAGSIRLPCPADELSCVVVRLGRLYGGLLPNFSATINGVEAQAQCFPIDQGYDVRVFPVPSGERDDHDAILTLVSEVWGSPADDGESDDKRILSAMVRHAEVFVVS